MLQGLDCFPMKFKRLTIKVPKLFGRRAGASRVYRVLHVVWRRGEGGGQDTEQGRTSNLRAPRRTVRLQSNPSSNFTP